MHLKEKGCEELDSSGSGQGTIASSSEHGNDHSGPIKEGIS
jgi:hypothetical protein